MATLRIFALGSPRVFYDQSPLFFPTKKPLDLLCILLLHAGETLERDLISEWLWPMHSPGKARRSLSTALWRLRQTLEYPNGPTQPFLRSERSTLAFNTTTHYWFDVEAFEQQAAFGLDSPLPTAEAHCEALVEAVTLYRGDLLDGCYDDWCLAERERLQLLLMRVLKRLQCHYRHCQAFEAAISYGHRLLTLDPLLEDVHRELMRCYEEAGQRPLALEQFRRCRETLRQELDIEPMPQTWRLYHQIRSGQQPAQFQEMPGSGHAPLQEALTRLRSALDALELVWQALQAATAEHGVASESTPGERVHPEHGR
jgi:DNA-binding SARP family transcriptional activator